MDDDARTRVSLDLPPAVFRKLPVCGARNEGSFRSFMSQRRTKACLPDNNIRNFGSELVKRTPVFLRFLLVPTFRPGLPANGISWKNMARANAIDDRFVRVFRTLLG